MHTFSFLLLLTRFAEAITSKHPTVSKSPNFRITAHLPTDHPLSIVNGWNLTSYHTSPCYGYAVFTNETCRTFYTNGTSEEFRHGASNLLSDGGTPLWPWGTFVAPPSSTDNEGRRNVFINCGEGTEGVKVGGNGLGPQVVYGTGEFYICNSTFIYGPAITLYYRERDEGMKEGCMGVVLKPWCVGGEEGHEFDREEECLMDG